MERVTLAFSPLFLFSGEKAAFGGEKREKFELYCYEILNLWGKCIYTFFMHDFGR